MVRSLDFADIEALQMRGEWDTAGALLNAEAKALERGGAELLILATNTMHKLVELIMADVKIPLIHLADATAQAIVSKCLKSPGLMGTVFTMEQSFYTDRLIAYGLSTILPGKEDRADIHRKCYCWKNYRQSLWQQRDFN